MPKIIVKLNVHKEEYWEIEADSTSDVHGMTALDIEDVGEKVAERDDTYLEDVFTPEKFKDIEPTMYDDYHYNKYHSGVNEIE